MISWKITCNQDFVKFRDEKWNNFRNGPSDLKGNGEKKHDKKTFIGIQFISIFFFSLLAISTGNEKRSRIRLRGWEGLRGVSSFNLKRCNTLHPWEKESRYRVAGSRESTSVSYRSPLVTRTHIAPRKRRFFHLTRVWARPTPYTYVYTTRWIS